MEVVINYWALLGCVVYAMVVGFLWYGPLFGKIWSRESGFTEADKAAALAKPTQMYLSYVLTAIGALAIAYVLNHGLVFGNEYLGMSMRDLGSNMMGALWFWLGFVVPVVLNEVLFGKKTWTVFGINIAYYLVLLLGMSAILTYWG
jgi:hypothetical protein